MMISSADSRLRVFIGDVQGCASELERLLERLDYDRDRHALYFVGDIVNRGPRSLDALRLVRREAAGVVLGNHDLHLIARAAGIRSGRPGDTLDDVLEAPDRDELVAWLRRQPAILEWDDLVLVHAGLCPTWGDLGRIDREIRDSVDWSADPIDNADLRFATTVRYCGPAGELPPPEVGRPATRGTRPGHPGDIDAPYAPWDHFWNGPRTVVFGHWAQRGLVRGRWARGLDTGCVWGGALTAWVAEEDRVLEEPAAAPYQEPA